MSKIETNSYDKASIDSFSYRIPMSVVRILDERILQKQVECRYVADTGEEISSKPIQQNSLHPQRSGYKIHFQIQKMPNETFLVVLINSKLLEYEYLKGISMNNIELVYNNLMRCNVFHCSFEDFLSYGIMSDIDIKKDMLIEKEHFLSSLKELERGSILRKGVNDGVKVYNKESENIGIQWNNREKATATKPFVKIYFKELEAQLSDAKQVNKDEIPFFATYVNEKELVNRTRIEVTIKNQKSAKVHGIENLKMLNVLSLTPSQLSDIIKKNLNLNLNQRVPNPPKPRTDISPTDLLAYIHLTNMINNQLYSIENAITFTINQYSDAMQKYRMKIKLNDVYSKYIATDIHINRVEKVNDALQKIGWSNPAY